MGARTLSHGFTEGSAEGVRMLGRVACVDALGRKRASVDGTGRVYGKTGGFGLDRGGAVHPRCAPNGQRSPTRA